MPVNLLDLEPRSVWLAIPVDAHDRQKGVVHVQLRELPYGKSQALDARWRGTLAHLETLEAAQARVGAPTEAEIEAVGDAWIAVRSANLEAVRWGVMGHREEDFLLGRNGDSLPIPFEPETLSYHGQSYACASARMLRLYMLSGGGGARGEGTLLRLLAKAVLAFQRGETVTPEEIWAEAEKPEPAP